MGNIFAKRCEKALIEKLVEPESEKAQVQDILPAPANESSEEVTMKMEAKKKPPATTEEHAGEEAVDFGDDPLAMLGGMGEDEVYKVTLMEDQSANAEEKVVTPEQPLADEGMSARVVDLSHMPTRFIPEELDTDGKRPKFRILAYGDSLTAGYYVYGGFLPRFAPYGMHMANALFPDVSTEIWVNGLSGLTAADLAPKLEATSIRDGAKNEGKGIKAVLDAHGIFDLVLIMIGTNDLGKAHIADVETSARDISENVKKLHAACHECKVSTAVLSVPENKFLDPQQNRRLRLDKCDEYTQCWIRLNSLLQEWAESCKDVAFFANVPQLLPWSSDTGYWHSDGIHLSPKGSEKLGELIANEVKRYRECLHGSSGRGL